MDAAAPDASLAAFASALRLDADDLRASLQLPCPRFVRKVLASRDSDLDVTVEALRAGLGGAAAAECAWLPGTFVVDGSAKLSGSTLYESGRVAGIDASSAAAAFLLDPRPGEAVLDLCCAPGGKTALLADIMGLEGWLCGVDVSAERLGAACTVLRRLGIVRAGDASRSGWRLQLFCADGTTFPAGDAAPRHLCRRCPLSPSESAPTPPGAPTAVLDSWVEALIRGGKGHAGSATARGLPPPLSRRNLLNAMQQRLHQRSLPSPSCSCLVSAPWEHCCSCPLGGDDDPAQPAPLLFDRVLVDAECTHDGSAKHLSKFGTQWGWETFERRVLDATRLGSLEALQRGLLA